MVPGADGEGRIRELESRIADLERRLEDARGAGSDPYRALFENSADAILIIEGDRFIDCNQATVRMLRYGSREELLETHPSELSPEFQPDGRRSFEKANEMIARAFEKGSHRFEWEHVRADGEVFPVEVLLTAVPEGERRVLHVVWRDITERKRLESELRQAQKMEAVGKLAGGIAHDFNNLLVVILGHAELLAHSLEEQDIGTAELTEIRRAAERAASLVGQLLAFSRRQVLQPKVLDLDAAITDMTRMLRRLVGEDVRIDHRPAERPLKVKADPGQIDQVVLNLVTNARDAMPRGGEITLQVREWAFEAGQEGALPPGEYVALEVSDTGVGMDEQTMARVFDPFFTTKALGRGTGLGLSTVYGIVRQSGGDVQVFSRPGEGTTFRVLLPLCEEEIEAVAERRSAPEPAGPCTVVVVEDEPAVAALISRVLEKAGYQVVHYASGEEAVEALSGPQPPDYDLLISDVVMPGLTGPELVGRLGAGLAGRPVLFMSGYTDYALIDHGFEPNRVPLLRKPFSTASLLEAADRLLAKRNVESRASDLF